MKQNHLHSQKKRSLLFLYCLFWLLSINYVSAQDAITLTWNKESGCQIYKEGERKDLIEDIEQTECVRVCERSTVIYSLSNVNSSWTTVWNVTGGTINTFTLTNSSCEVNWGLSGPGQVTATITTDNGIQTRGICVEIIDAPNAKFNLEPFDSGDKDYTVCLEQLLDFTNLSTDGGGSELVSYLWDFGDGNYSSEFDPTHQYMAPGSYTVTLTVTNACNCTNTTKKKIKVEDILGFDIICNSVVCEGEKASYSVPPEIAEKCGDKGKWVVEGGTVITSNAVEIEVIWDEVNPGGFGYVTYEASGCAGKCSITTIKVPVVLSEGTIQGDGVVCAESQIRYKLPQWPTTNFNWSIYDPNGTGAQVLIPDQRNEVIVQTNHEGTFYLRCTYQNTLLNCGGTAEKEIKVKPIGFIDGPMVLCEGDSGSYTVNGYTGTWTLRAPDGSTLPVFTGTTFNHVFNIPGKYTLFVEGNDFCSDERPFIIRVDAIPAIPDIDDIIGPRKVCTGTPVEYSIENNVAGTVLGWEAINGTISGSNYGEEITVEFTPGYTVYGIRVWRENSKDPHCKSALATLDVTEFVVVMDVTGPTEDICASSITEYTANYDEGETYEWTIVPAEAGSVKTGQGTPEISVQWNNYVTSGTQIQLKVRKCAVFYYDTLDINIYEIPTVEITEVEAFVCPDENIYPVLASNPTLTEGTVTWDWGDGSDPEIYPYHQDPLPHDYGNPVSGNASYTITASVNSPNGCETVAVASFEVTVMPRPVAFISPGADVYYCGTFPQDLELTATLQAGYSATTTIEWYNSGVLVGTGNTYLVTGPGIYYAYVENPNGCGRFTNAVRVEEECDVCDANATVTMDAYQASCATINATASASPAPIVWGWATPFPSGVGPQTATSASFTFDEAGDHIIIYNATYINSSGQLCTLQRYDTVTIPFIPGLLLSTTCSDTAGTYEVSLLDYSNYHPGYPPETLTYIVDGVMYPVPVGTDHLTVTLSPGLHTFGIKLTRTGFADCEYSTTEYLDPIANAGIDLGGDTCHGTALELSPNTPVVTGLSYFWDFGDGSTNSQPNTVKVYGTPGLKTIKLTISNADGCFSEDIIQVEVLPNLLGGNLTTDSPNCEDEPITLTFNNTGSTPTLYKWMRDQEELDITTSPVYQVNESGSYWVTLEDQNGCYKYLDAVPAKFIMAPDPVIDGPDGVCTGESFTLSGYAGGGNIEYRWLIDGVPQTGFSNSTNFTHTFYSVGSYTFTVEARVSDGNGAYCIGSASHIVTSYGPAHEPEIYFNVLNCDPYTVEIVANAYDPGTYTWSNGMSGSTITVNSGGPYMVTFTNLGGCTSVAQIDIPKDPESYFWIFPSGCYEFCNKDGREPGPHYLIGPNAEFEYWAWEQNGNPDQTGNSYVQDYQIPFSGIYNMTLNNSYCEKTTDPMTVSITPCECSIKWEIRELVREERPFCHYKVIMTIDNPHGYPITVSITAENGVGVFNPGVVTVPPGGGTYSLQFIPFSYSGGTFDITLRTELKEGELCRSIEEVEFPPICGEGQYARASMDDVMENDAILLLVAPNPVSETTTIAYTYGSEPAKSRVIEIYSLLGTLIESYTPETGQGKWTVNLSRYPSGQYIVVMRENGSAVAQKGIIIE